MLASVVMPSPFPGMDPWLELRWRDVHASIVVYIRNELQRQLPDSLVARAEEDILVNAADLAPKLVRPDVTVAEEPPGAEAGGVAVLTPPATVAKPFLVRLAEPEVDRRVEIIDLAFGERVVTAIEVLSPANKLPGRAREAYRAKQRDFIAGGVNFIEIDLVRQGQWVFSADEATVPLPLRTLYMVCVFRATDPDVRAFYSLALREPLPRLAIPLRPGDRDVALDLQAVINQAYEDGRYERTDYRRPLNPPLSCEDAAWAANLLRQAGKI
jgi:Protein of unknown function (DUF4058)